MTLLQKLLLLPCLSPLVAALVVAGLNLRQPTSLRLLTWRSGPLPIGAWIALSATGSALVTVAWALTAGSSVAPLRRQVHRPIGWNGEAESVRWPESESWPSEPARPVATQIWPERDVRDPAPTVSVPFRVVKRGAGSPNAGQSSRSAAATNTSADTTTDTVASPSPSTGATAVGADDWDQPLPGGW